MAVGAAHLTLRHFLFNFLPADMIKLQYDPIGLTTIHAALFSQ